MSSDTSYVCPRCKHHHALRDEHAGGWETKCESCNFRFRFFVKTTVSIEEECVEHTWGEYIDGWNSEICFCKLCGTSQKRDKDPKP